MSEYFQAKVSSLQQQSNGLIAKVVETYLIDAMSFTEAEARAIKESEGSREVTAVAIARSPIKEVVMYGDTDQFFKVKVCYSLMDEETEKEKKVTTYFLVNANDAKEAYERTEEHLKEMLVPFTIPKIEESPIIEVYQYEKAAPKGFVKVEKADTVYRGDEIDRDIECAMEDDSIEGDYPTEKDLQVVQQAGARLKAIDPTDGQAVAFEMDLVTYLQKIRPTITISEIEWLRDSYVTSDEAFLKRCVHHSFSEKEAAKVAEILANEAAFEQDEEDNETDLESRFDRAMKGVDND